MTFNTSLLSINNISRPNLFCNPVTYSRKVYWLKESYWRKNCLLLPPSIHNAPNTQVFWCDPVIVTTGRIPYAVHIFLRIKESCIKMDSSATATVNSLGICDEIIIFLAFFEIHLSLVLTQH